MGARDGCVGEKFFGVHTTGAALMAAHTRNREHETGVRRNVAQKHPTLCSVCTRGVFSGNERTREADIYRRR